jgi:hypothetical protein
MQLSGRSRETPLAGFLALGREVGIALIEAVPTRRRHAQKNRPMF